MWITVTEQRWPIKTKEIFIFPFMPTQLRQRLPKEDRYKESGLLYRQRQEQEEAYESGSQIQDLLLSQSCQWHGNLYLGGRPHRCKRKFVGERISSDEEYTPDIDSPEFRVKSMLWTKKYFDKVFPWPRWWNRNLKKEEEPAVV